MELFCLNKFKQLHYQNIKPNGISKVLSSLTSDLSDQGYEIDILYLMAPHEDFYPINPKIKKHYSDSFADRYSKLATYLFKNFKSIPKIYNIHSYLYDLGSYRVLKKWIKKNHRHYDTIVPCWYKLSSMLALDSEVSKKTIAWEHISYKTGGKLWYGTLRKYYKNLKGIVCINKGGFDHYNSLNKNTHFIYNIIDDHLDSLSYIPPLKKENLISMICRLDPEKNVMAFLEIFLKSNIPTDWKAEIMGQGREKETLQKFLEANNLQNRIKFLGHGNSDDVYRLMARSKISCLTSTNEAFGMVLLEAMFSSNALIAYDCDYGPSDIINEKNGFLIPLHDPEPFIKSLEKLTHDENLLNTLMKSSFEETAHWKKEKITQQWKKIL